MNGNGTSPVMADSSRWSRGHFPGVGGDEWHRVLTGRQSPEPVSAKLRMIYGTIVAEDLPEPVSAKLRMIYGTIVAEDLPDRMLDLLSRLDQKRPE